VHQERKLLFCRIRLDLKRIGASIPLLLVPQTWVLMGEFERHGEALGRFLEVIGEYCSEAGKNYVERMFRESFISHAVCPHLNRVP
jgi:hypothetical protein